MFRKPRTDDTATALGRPPSPPPTPSPFNKATKPSPKSDVPPPSIPTMTSVKPLSRSSTPNKIPTIGRQGPTSNSRVKPPAQSNGSILNFFKKKEGQGKDDINGAFGETMFVEENSPRKNTGLLVGLDAGHDRSTADLQAAKEEELARFNEVDGPVKRRRISPDDQPTNVAGDAAPIAPNEAGCTPPPDDEDDDLFGDRAIEQQTTDTSTKDAQNSGPFMQDSDDEGEAEDPQQARWMRTQESPSKKPHDHEDTQNDQQELREPSRHHEDIKAPPPLLKHSSTSYTGGAGFDDFEGMGDFEDEYEDGDEAVERRWVREQMRLERMAADGHFEGDLEDDEFDDIEDDGIKEEPDAESAQVEAQTQECAIATCPICDVDFKGVSDADASVHVNNCLDGRPTPLPTKSSSPTKETKSEQDPAASAPMKPKFQRPARPARPGQANPFNLVQQETSSSAFTKLMSGHTEEAAWADAAAAENASRGKPSYQRTCPFYKILPGFSIAVDAFRYGAVQGCNAYFLSHFHSDHYVGLHASWNHGPIYCSRPTANLVKQQLRVDKKWVVPLEWEQRTEVPGTQGVYVTMIPANHCPGSSLYLFEKIIGKGPKPKLQRVLHCGDFRACPAHIEHPLLKPEVMDAVSGKTQQQKIDVCYLDTTYLSPKWAFPSQEEVIKACADMCVSLNKVRVDENDGWEQMKRERAGSAMTKFVRRDSKEDDQKPPPADDEETTTTTTPAKPSTTEKKDRGGLLVVVGTYSIGKERICLGIARALNSKIYAPAGKQRICAALEDAELNSRLTSDPYEAQVHMTPLFEIRAETLADYLAEFKNGRFKRAVGFRPTGWNYKPPGSRFTDSPSVQTVLYSDNWKSTYTMKDLIPQRGSTTVSSCFGVPYSEHSSFRELTMFCCALNIEKIIPTVNVGSAKSRERMKVWCERWAAERKKNGLFRLCDQDGVSHWYPSSKGTWELRTTL